MRLLGKWLAEVGVGFVRACVVLAVSLPVPAVRAAAVAWGIRWGAGNPWSWAAPSALVCVGTLGLGRPVCRTARFLVARWTTTVIPAGYRQAGPVTRMATEYWWNGHSYARSRRDALMDQKWRVRWSDPANWRDLRFTGIAPLTAGIVAALPPAGSAAAVIAFGRPEPAARLAVTVELEQAPQRGCRPT
ncbi:hypothetical protein [Streptomyces sp. NPDC054838]